VVKGFWKGDCDQRFVVDEVYDTSARLPGVKGGGDTGVCGAAVLLVANEMIRTAKQLPEVSRIAVWGRAALCLAGASCDWWGGNWEEELNILPVDAVEEYWKGDCGLRFVADEVYDISARLPGSKVGEILVYVGLEWGVMGWSEGLQSCCWPMG
jgi:hypothetical protein